MRAARCRCCALPLALLLHTAAFGPSCRAATRSHRVASGKRLAPSECIPFPPAPTHPPTCLPSPPAPCPPAGNRPSTSLLLPAINAFTVGQLLSLYENRVAAQGFMWGINSFDQWGVELGKVCCAGSRCRAGACAYGKGVTATCLGLKLRVGPPPAPTGQGQGVLSMRPYPPRALLPPAHPLTHAPQVLATRVREMISVARTKTRRIVVSDGFVPATRKVGRRRRTVDPPSRRLPACLPA